MKILHIHPSMASGGIESMICSLANEMSKTEEVTVCSIYEPVPSDSFWFKLHPKVKKCSIGGKKEFSFRLLFCIYNFICRGKYDVINIHGMFYYYVIAVLFLRKRYKFFYTVHSDANMENTIWDKRLFRLKKYAFAKGWVNAITISAKSQRSFKELYRVDDTLIFNGVPLPKIKEDNVISKYRINENTKIFIHAGRISIPKNQLVLCKVFNRLIAEGHDILLLIVGSKQNEDIFHNIQPYFSDRIIYLGQRDDVPQLMAYSDAMCLPSIWEGLPVTILEALSVGCIPICSNVGGIPDVVISGENGMLADSSSEEDYYNILHAFLGLSSDDILRMKQNCMSSFSKYDIRSTSRSYINLYQSLLKS